MKSFILSVLFFSSVLMAPAAQVHAATAPLETQLAELREYVARMVDARNATPLTDDELRKVIAEGTKWLTNAQQSSGRFRYEFRPYEDTYTTDDNIVRQAGALFALTEVLKHDADDPLNLSGSAEDSIDHFDRISKEGEYNGTKFRCVTQNGASTRCELGATALVLTSILGYIEHAPEKTSRYQKQIDDYRAFILAMQKENGGFQNLYLIGRPSQSTAESPFSNGEALLALTRLYNSEKDDEAKDAIERALAYLVKLPYDTALYLWIMAAMKEIDDIDVRLQNTPYVRDFTLWRIERGASVRSTNRNFCAYTEGVVSALSVLKGRVPDTVYARVLQEAEYGLRKNRPLQLTEADATRAFVNTDGLVLKSFARPLRAVGGFLTGEDEPVERIDFTQHCVNAHLQMLTDVRGKRLVR
jgi:hypothetical protein